MKEYVLTPPPAIPFSGMPRGWTLWRVEDDGVTNTPVVYFRRPPSCPFDVYEAAMKAIIEKLEGKR